MYNIFELYTIKSKKYETKKEILDNLTLFCLQSPRLDLKSILKNDEIIDINNISVEEFIRLCLFSIYASDIATIPDRQSRNFYIEELKTIANEYNLSYQKVSYLSIYAEQFYAEIERNQNPL